MYSTELLLTGGAFAWASEYLPQETRRRGFARKRNPAEADCANRAGMALTGQSPATGPWGPARHSPSA